MRFVIAAASPSASRTSPAAEPRRVENVDGLPTNRFQFQPQPLHSPRVRQFLAAWSLL